MGKFGITMAKGFHITFDNGITVSVQFGPHNYCENRDYGNGSKVTYPLTNDISCINAEVAAWNSKGEWYKLREDDEVIGWVTPNQLLLLMNQLALLTGDEDVEEISELLRGWCIR